MGPVCRTSTPAPTACFNPRIHQPLSPLVHSALPPTLVRPPLLEYATSSFYTSGTPGFLSGMVPRPSGMRCGSVGSATDAGSVSEGRASDDVDPPYEPGGWVPVPDVVGRAGRRVGACGVCVDSVLRRVRDSAGSVPGQGAGRPEQRQRRRGRGAGERGTPVPDARNVAGPDHRGAAGPTPGTPRGCVRGLSRCDAEGVAAGGRVRPDVQRPKVCECGVGGRGRGDAGAHLCGTSARTGARHRLCGGARVLLPVGCGWGGAGGHCRGGRGGVRSLGLPCGGPAAAHACGGD